MKKLLIILSLMTIIHSFPMNLKAQTMLEPGDLIITGMCTDNPDTMMFVLLKEIEKGTQIYFTDKGYNNQDTTFIDGEGYLVFTANSNYEAGSMITYIEGSPTDEFSVPEHYEFSNFSFATSGDQCLAFQGDTINPRFIFAVQTNSTEWQTSLNPEDNIAENGSEISKYRVSTLPTNLKKDTTALALGKSSYGDDEWDNVWYDGPTTGTIEEIQNFVTIFSNWSKNNNLFQAGKEDFTIKTEQTPPTITDEGTELSIADIIIIGAYTDNPDQFSFVFLRDVEKGTKITFTDAGWNLSTESFINNESFVYYTASQDYKAGSIITWNRDNYTSEFSYTNNWCFDHMSLSAAGDQCFAFQGDTTSPKFIFALQTNSTVYQTSMLPSENLNVNNEEVSVYRMSNVPAGLTEGFTAISVGQSSYADDEYDNVWYVGPTSGTKEEIVLAVSNSANWTGDMEQYNPYTINFTINESSTSGIAKTVSNKILVYPNPTHGTIHVQSDDDIMSIELFDITGKTIKKIMPEFNQTTFNLCTVSKGIYHLKINTVNNISFEKILVQ
jgi:hypothetical protein